MKKFIISFALLSVVISTVDAKSVEELIKENGCMSCHNIVGMKDAPPFAGIAMRATKMSSNPKEVLINSIKNGSSGKYQKFAGKKMPAFKNLSDEELDTIASWILSQASNMPMHRGYHGGGHHHGRGHHHGMGMGRGMMN